MSLKESSGIYLFLCNDEQDLDEEEPENENEGEENEQEEQQQEVDQNFSDAGASLGQSWVNLVFYDFSSLNY